MPATRVDLRSSLDPDPSPACVCTDPGNQQQPSQTPQRRRLTRPRSFRDDTEAISYRPDAGSSLPTMDSQLVDRFGGEFVVEDSV
jgi:hypothetical protein